MSPREQTPAPRTTSDILMAMAGANNSPLFPATAFININHLGISQRSRFNAKQRLMARLASRNVFVGVQEIHLSPARAQAEFFDHLTSHSVLYNADGVAAGTAILIQKAFLEKVGVDDASLNHWVIIPNVAHAFK